MSVKVTINPGAWQALKLVVVVTAFAATLTILASLVSRREDRSLEAPSHGRQSLSALGAETDLLLPTVSVCVPRNATERVWSEALAERVGGASEYSIPHGRVDVLASRFAIEVDRLEKWHEGIGQSLHYADATGRRPALALILQDGGSRSEILSQVDRVTTEQGIRLFLLKRACSTDDSLGNAPH